MILEKRLEELFVFIRNGKSIKQKDGQGGIPITRIETIWNESIDTERLGYADISRQDLGLYKQYLMKQGDILMSHINSPKHLGKSAMYFGVPKNLIHGMNLLCLRPNQELIDPLFISYYFNSLHFRSQVTKISNQSVNQASFSAGNLKKLNIPLPPLEEQKKIAAILDAADDYRQKSKALIDKYDQLTQSLFLDMFGDPVTNPNGWNKETLKNCTNKIGSGATPRGGKEAYKEEGISLIRSLNIHDNWFKIKDLAFIDDFQANELNGVIVKANDVMFNITGASVCRCCIVPQNILPARVNQHVAIIRTKTEILNSTFLLHCFLSQNVKSHLLALGGMGGATREALTKSDLETFKTIIPPIRLQNQFAERVALIEKQKQQAEASLVKVEELFSSLLQRAFKGELTN